MRISQKLALGFLGTSLIVGMIGISSVRQNLITQTNPSVLGRNSISEAKNAWEIANALQRSALLAQTVLALRFREGMTPQHTELGLELAQVEAEIQRSFRDVENRLRLAMVYEQSEAQIAQSIELEMNQELGLQRLEALQTEFKAYKALLSQYLALAAANPNQAKRFLDQTLNPHFKQKLAPLVQLYQQDLENQVFSEALVGKAVTSATNHYIAAVTLSSVVVAIILSFLISYSIHQQITKLKVAAEAVGKGKLDSQVDLSSQDEFGVLATAFNQMITDLGQITVSKSYLDRILDSMIESLMVLSPDATIAKVNQATLKLLGYQEVELIGQHIHTILATNFQTDSHLDLTVLLKSGLTESCEATYTSKSGAKIPVACSASLIWDDAKKSQGIVLVARDITELKKAQAELLHSATHDALTGLPNRALFQERLNRSVQLSKQPAHYLYAVLFLDLDRFKVINDSLGHLAGDQLLIGIAERVKACVREEDTVARLGGDEFAILLENIKHLDDAIEIAHRIQAQLSLPFTLLGQEVYASTSIGIALSTKGYNNLEEIIRDADTAMYQSKSQGRARFTVFDQTLHEQALKQLQIENDLRRAIERHELQVYYQPIVSLSTQQWVGFEALVRWQHPEFGDISPSDFIPIAEEANLISPIGYWVLQNVCEQLQSWKKAWPGTEALTIHVNLSGKQLREPDLALRIQEILALTDLNPTRLKLEITETVFVESAKTLTDTFLQLQAQGVCFAIDDFGTGYSSLASLHRFPVDTLKIDRTFIDHIDQDSDQVELVRAVVTLAHNLEITAIAEGIETPAQLDQLHQLGCDCGQGYLFSRPVSAQEATQLLQQQYQPAKFSELHPLV